MAGPARQVVVTSDGAVVIQFPTEEHRDAFHDAMEQIREAGDDPGLWWEDLYGRYGGRVVREL